MKIVNVTKQIGEIEKGSNWGRTTFGTMVELELENGETTTMHVSRQRKRDLLALLGRIPTPVSGMEYDEKTGMIIQNICAGGFM